MREYIFNKKSPLIILAILLSFALFYFFFFKSTEAQVCLPLSGYLVWPGTWEAGRIPMASNQQYVLTASPIYVSGSNVGIGTTIPGQKLDVYGGYIRSDTGFCIGTSCITSWPAGGGGYWAASGNNIYNTNTGYVGIGTTNPNNRLQVVDLINFNNTDFNTFLGYQAGKNVVAGAQYNTFIGYQAGFASSTAASSTADYNTAIGYQALYSNTGGYSNTAIGPYALYSNTTGDSNTAIGNWALYSNTIGEQNTAIGPYALYSNTRGFSNTALGNWALFYNTTGYSNTAIGKSALLFNTTGYHNTAIGTAALERNTTGYHNTAIGTAALERNTTGYHNTAIGTFAGRYIYDGTTANATSTYSVYIGADTKASFSGATNEIVIGYNAVGAGSNSVVLGNDSITKTILKGNVGIGTTAPGYKLDIAGALRLRPSSAPTGANGVIYYDSTVNKFRCYENGAWTDCIGAGGGGYWAASGNNIYNTNTGNVGIGTTTPVQKLHVEGNTYISGNVGIGTTAPATKLAVVGLTSSQTGRSICADTNGNFYYFDGSCRASSIKYKTNVQNLGIGLETLLKLRPVTFEFKKDYGGYDGTIHMGFIAEEVEKVSPLLVDYNNGEVSGVRYDEMNALIVKSIQEQQKEIEDLKKEIEELKKIIAR
jgi:hypothetical protein